MTLNPKPSTLNAQPSTKKEARSPPCGEPGSVIAFRIKASLDPAEVNSVLTQKQVVVA